MNFLIFPVSESLNLYSNSSTHSLMRYKSIKQLKTKIQSHKYKDSREHFEMRTHKRLIDIVDPTPKAVDSLMHIDLPADVNIEIKL